MLLSDLKRGDSAKVLKINVSRNIRDRLLKIGLTENVMVKVIRFAPFGDPMEIRLRDFSLAIRKSEAKRLIVEKIR